MSKNENRELNAILAELKKSYSGDEEIENEESRDMNDDFQKLISNYFSDDSDKDIYKFTANKNPDPENITAQSDYSLADFEGFTVEEESVDEVIEEAVEEIVEEPVEEVIEETIVETVAEAIEESVEESVEETIVEAVEETIEETIVEAVEETIEKSVEEVIDDKAIVDDVFEVMFPSRFVEPYVEKENTNKAEEVIEETEYEPIIEETQKVEEKTEAKLEVVEPKVEHTPIESRAKMFDFDEFNDYDYYDSSVVDLPMPSGDILANKNEAVLEQTNIETVEPQYVPLQTNIENSDEPQLTPVAENKETIDDIIGDMTLPDQDEVTLDMSAIIDTKTIDSEEVLEIEADEAEESKVEYLSDPLQGHLSDAAFVTYKIAADEVDFELEENNADLDDEEISLLLDFGYDDEVEAEVGYERTSEIKRKSKSHVVESDKIYGYCGEEYISKTQNTKIKHEYAKDKRDLLVRGGIFASITLVLFLFSIINCVGVNINYSLYFLVEFLLLSAASVVAFPEMKRGVMGIIKLEPNYYSIPVIVLSITGLYEIFTIIYVLLTAETMLVGTLLPCGFIAAMFVLTSLVSDILECFAQADSFELISRADELYTAEKFNKNKIFEASSGKSREKTSLNGAFFGDQIFEIKRIGVPQGYFSRMSKKQYNLSYSFYSLGVIITVSIIVACIALVKSNSIATATYSLMTVILMGLPLSLALFTTLPKFISSKRLLRRGCAIAGDVACEEYSLMETLIFSDEDAVEVVEKLEIRPESDSDLASSIKIATRALKALGGPVSTMVAGAFTEIGAKAPEIEISSIRDNGIEFYMDSSIYMLIGDASFMSSFGIKVSSDYGVGDHLKHNNVIYIAIDGVPKLGYVIESKIKSDFISLVLELDKFGIKTAVSSFDPTINDYYFEQNRIHGASVISTYKPEKFYNRSGKSIAEGGLFCVGDPKNIIHPLTESRRLHSINKLNKIISLLLSLLGCAIATLFIIFILLENTFRVLTLATILMILIFHLTAAIPAVLNSFDLKKKERPINE